MKVTIKVLNAIYINLSYILFYLILPMNTHDNSKRWYIYKINIYNMMHKLTSITYLIMSQSKKYWKFNLCIPTGKSYSPPNFNSFQWDFVPIFPNSWAT